LHEWAEASLASKLHLVDVRVRLDYRRYVSPRGSSGTINLLEHLHIPAYHS
jgi:hypothetical protein